MGESQRRELHEALLDAASFEDLPGKWQGGDRHGGAEPFEPSRRQRGDYAVPRAAGVV
jgi:hypothetical protein